MQISVFSLIFQGIPENIGLITLAFVLAGAELNWKKLFLLGSTLALTAFFIRMLPITFGIHTIVLICLLVFFVTNFSEANLTTAIMSALISFICLVVFEITTHMTAFKIFQIPMEVVTNNQMLKLLVGMPQVILLFLSSIIIRKYRKRV